MVVGDACKPRLLIHELGARPRIYRIYRIRISLFVIHFKFEHFKFEICRAILRVLPVPHVKCFCREDS